MIHRHSRKIAAAVSTALVLSLASGSPVIAKTASSTAAAIPVISTKDKQAGAQQHPALLEEFGGAVTGPQAAYVETVGKNIAVQTGMSSARSDFTVTLLNSSVNNAFAIPGGYIYVTRQLASLMNNEAELAAVLGHEAGHVAARHATRRQKAATQSSIIGVLGSVLAGAVLGNSGLGNIIQQGLPQFLQMNILRYSRNQETEADNLGIAYLKKAGYDPKAMSTVLQSLASQNALEARLMGNTSQVPAWASTHPDPASRVRAALAVAGSNSTGITNRDQFLRGIAGVTYGDDPKQGVIEGTVFTHPSLKMQFRAPAGFYMMNGSSAVTVGGQQGKGQFTGGQYNGNLAAYVGSVFQALSQQNQVQINPGAVQATTVNGIPAAYSVAQVQGQDGAVDVAVFAYEWGPNSAFHFMTITPTGQAGVFNPMFQSMRRISDSEAAGVKARKLTVYTVKAGDTVQSLASRMAYSDAPLERFLVLNALTASSRLSAGQKVKLVTY